MLAGAIPMMFIAASFRKYGALYLTSIAATGVAVVAYFNTFLVQRMEYEGDSTWIQTDLRGWVVYNIFTLGVLAIVLVKMLFGGSEVVAGAVCRICKS